MVDQLVHRDVSGSILGAAMTVLNTLKPGLEERIYERALWIELEGRGHRAERQAYYPVHYRGERVGTLVPDLIVEGRVIVEAKVVFEFNEHHLSQMLGYLSITGLQLGLLLNFRYLGLRWRRVVLSAVSESPRGGESGTKKRPEAPASSRPK